MSLSRVGEARQVLATEIHPRGNICSRPLLSFGCSIKPLSYPGTLPSGTPQGSLPPIMHAENAKNALSQLPFCKAKHSSWPGHSDAPISGSDSEASDTKKGLGRLPPGVRCSLARLGALFLVVDPSGLVLWPLWEM